MTPRRLQSILVALHWSQRGLAAVLGCSDSLVRSWASGRQPVPPPVASWLEARALVVQALPPPVDFRRSAGRPARGVVARAPRTG